jgi:predicted nuclease of predicted toxin-antitoxin system
LAATVQDAMHVLDVGLLEARDSEIWDYALKHACVLLSKDEDFAIRASVAPISPQIVWVRIGNCSNARLLEWFAGELNAVIAALATGDRLVELRG